MGDLHPPSLRGRAVQMDAARRRQGRAARRGRAQELEGAPLDRHPGVGGVMLRQQQATCSALILRSAEGASRRMASCFETHRSTVMLVDLQWSVGAAMLLSMRLRETE